MKMYLKQITNNNKSITRQIYVLTPIFIPKEGKVKQQNYAKTDFYGIK